MKAHSNSIQRGFYILMVITLAGGISIGLSACGNSSSKKGKYNHKPSPTVEVIEKNIAEMEAKPWDKQVYLAIQDDQIDASTTITEKAKKGLKQLLNVTYAKVLVREGNEILANCSQQKHKHLRNVMAELTTLKKEKLPNLDSLDLEDQSYSALKHKYEEHESMMKFVNGMHAKQHITNLNQDYDITFEKEIEAGVKERLAQKPTCIYIKKNLEDKDNCFRKRREQYSADLVTLYCQDTVYVEAVERKVKSKINQYYGNKYGGMKPEWQDKFRDFEEKYRREEESE